MNDMVNKAKTSVRETTEDSVEPPESVLVNATRPVGEVAGEKLESTGKRTTDDWERLSVYSIRSAPPSLSRRVPSAVESWLSSRTEEIQAFVAKVSRHRLFKYRAGQ
jgi:hypothetical protein